MHPLSFASLVVAAMVFIGGASIAAGDQPTPPVLPTGPLPTAPPGKVGYFALLQPVAQVRANQPGLDQFTTDLDIALRKAAPIAFSRLIGINAPAAKLVDARACASVHVHGFVWPGRSFKIDDTSVTVSARVRVIDCLGSVFFDDASSEREDRNQNAVPQTQLDEVQAKAIDEVAAKFGAFRAEHESAWDVLVKTGTLDGSSVAPAVTTPSAKDS
jgi:hypothetical protein